MKKLRLFRFFIVMVMVLASGMVFLQDAAGAEEKKQDALKQDAILLTIFLKHDQSKTLDEINEHLEETGFWKKFPPQGTEVVSWYVMMGIGQVVTLRVPPDKLRAVNLSIEENAWGAYKTEFYATYDYKTIWETTRRR
jgi:ABC-type tungstate transport system permease subunit